MASMNEKDYYEILGVSKDATKEEIRKAFQEKARTLHPDINKAPDAEERFKEVSEAYAVLSDESKRARYDAMRSGSPFSAPSYGGGTYGGGAYGGGSYGDPMGGDPFEGWTVWGFPFGGARRTTTRRSRAYNPKAGSDVVFELELGPEVARKGCKKGVTYQHYATCEKCHGEGSVHSAHADTCPTCGGSGHMTIDLTGFLGLGTYTVTCPECEGTGKVVSDPCEDCGGSGRVLTASELVVDVPANVHDGAEIRIEGKGNAGTNGSEAGDFVCRVGVPSERLSVRQRFGFSIVGFVAPLIAFGLLTKGAAGVSAFTVIIAVVGLYMALRDGISSRSARWWGNAGRCFLGGLVYGLVLAVLSFGMSSCGAAAKKFFSQGG